MTVQILKKEAVVLDTATVLAQEIDERVDAYGSASEELIAKMKELEPLTNLVSELKKSLLDEAEEIAPTDTVTYSGENFAVKMGKKSKQVVATDKKELLAALGEDTFFELASIGVVDIRKYCTPPQLEKILAEEPVGARRVKLEKI